MAEAENEVKENVRKQFGRSAALYASSDVHAKGESLDVLLELARPEPTWRALDVATGAGHTAMAFAPRVREVIAADYTPAMLEETAKLAAARGAANVRTRLADAESLPFEHGSFDLVLCRLAFHHFPHPDRAAAEFARVAAPGGRLGFADNIVVEDEEAAAVYNEFERIRDPSHVRVHSLAELRGLFESVGFAVGESRTLSKEFEFEPWADRQHATAEAKARLLEILDRLPPALEGHLRPRRDGGRVFFTLWEGVFVATKT